MKKTSEDIFKPEIPVVPSDWSILPFQKAVQVVSDKGKRVKQRSYLPTGNIPVIDQGQETIGGYTDDEDLVFDGVLPVILFGDHTRLVKYVDKRFAVGAEGVKILRPMEAYTPKFLYYLLRSLQIPSRGYSRHFQFLRKFHLPLAPEEQQKCIVAEIEKQFSRLDEAVANLKRTKANLKRYKAAVLKAAVEGNLTEDWRKAHPDVEPASKLLTRILTERRAKWTGRGKYKEPSQFLEGNCPDLPANWAWTSLDSIANVIDPNPSHRMPKYVDNGIPLISTENFFEPEGIDFTIGKTVSEKTLQEQKTRFVITEGDFVLSRIGTIGKTRFLPPSQTYCLSHALVFIQGLTSDIDRRYLRYLVASDATIEQAKLGVQSVGVPDLGMGKIRAFRIPLTCVAEQKEVVNEVERRMSVIDELETTVEASLTRANRLRQSILQAAFSGNLANTSNNNMIEPFDQLLKTRSVV